MMVTEAKIPGTEDAWETGELGTDANFAAAADDMEDAKIDEALALQPISIRLQKSLIDDFKLIAKLNGIGYQPLMRQVLARFAESEKKRILRTYVRETEDVRARAR
jgi:hypothetical protein